jgi:hypothetical protein
MTLANLGSNVVETTSGVICVGPLLTVRHYMTREEQQRSRHGAADNRIMLTC